MRYTFKPQSLKKRRLVVAGAAVAVLALVIVVLELTNVTHFFHNKPSKTFVATPTKGGASTNNQKGEPQSTNTTGGVSTNTTQPGDDKSANGGGTSATLLVPSGDFVSNHHPNLSGSPAPNTLSSVCTSSPGATCAITFTKDGITKSLPSQATDRAGSTYWNTWTLQSIGLTAGSWQVQAVASLNGQTKTTNDAMDLVVAQ